MGGRKSYPLEAVVGKGARTARAKSRLLSAVESKESRQIVSSALNLASKSDLLLDSLSEAVKAFDFVQSNAEAPTLGYNARKRLASEYWTKRRKETDTPSNTAIDRIIVDSIAKFIRRGKRR